MNRFARAALLASTLSLAVFARAQVIEIATYTGGEDDGAPVNGGNATTATDSSGHGNNLNLSNANPALWSVDVAPPTTLLGTSTYSYQFGGDTSFVSSGMVMPSATEFGLEVWVNLSIASGTKLFLLNGDGSDGMGIGILNGYWTGLLGGLAWLDGSYLDGARNGTNWVAATTGVWTHLAIVNTGGTTTFYLNGAAIDYANADPFYNTDPLLHLGANITEGSLDGQLDNARVFEINGTFNAATHLNLAIPEPSTYAALAGLAALGVVIIRRRRAA
jgi:Concanavalin A-like lectin/glucanases superfamily/PEP-CTERM motif